MVHDVLVLARATPKTRLQKRVNTGEMMAQPTRFGRVSKRKIIWEESAGPGVPINAKKSKKKRVEILEIAPASDSAPTAVYDTIKQHPTNSTPLIRVQKSPFYVR